MADTEKTEYQPDLAAADMINQLDAEFAAEQARADAAEAELNKVKAELAKSGALDFIQLGLEIEDWFMTEINPHFTLDSGPAWNWVLDQAQDDLEQQLNAMASTAVNFHIVFHPGMDKTSRFIHDTLFELYQTADEPEDSSSDEPETTEPAPDPAPPAPPAPEAPAEPAPAPAPEPTADQLVSPPDSDEEYECANCGQRVAGEAGDRVVPMGQFSTAEVCDACYQNWDWGPPPDDEDDDATNFSPPNNAPAPDPAPEPTAAPDRVFMTIWMRDDPNQEQGRGKRFVTIVEAMTRFRTLQHELQAALIEFDEQPVFAWNRDSP